MPLFVGGPADGRWMDAKTDRQFTVPIRGPVSPCYVLTPEKFEEIPRMQTAVYVPYSFYVCGNDSKPKEIMIMIPSGTNPEAAFRRLVECYRPCVAD